MRTDEEIRQAARQVILVIKLKRDALEKTELVWDMRWSRVTLFLTQGWDFDDRLRTWRLALTQDSQTGYRYRDASPTTYHRQELERRIKQYGEDGGLNAYL